MLAYEVLLMRLFSIIQWHHFAYMVISMALLGFGASGSFLALAGRRLQSCVLAAFCGGAALFGLTSIAAFAVAERLPFNALAVIWEPRQLLWLAVLYLLFATPFFCGASAIGLALSAFPERIARIYAFDLLGAGAGALGIILLLFAVTPSIALRLVGALGLLAVAAASLHRPRRRRLAETMAWLVAAAVLVAAPPQSWTALRLSEYKGLSQALRVPDAAVVDERSGPLGLLTVVDSPTIPFRHAPGLSLANTMEPARQLGVFTDGDALSVITEFDGRFERLAYLDFTTQALPYRLLDRPEVLVVGAGGGGDVLLALLHGASRVDAVELNPQLVELVRERHAHFAGDLYRRPEVRLHVAEARSFVAGGHTRYDLIQLPLLDSFNTAAAGTLGLAESYIYTVEAFADYLRRLQPGGYLAITRWLKLPPRDSLKLLATARAALERAGVSAPAAQLAMIRGWSTVTLLVKNGALTDADLAAIRGFAESRAFDLAWLPRLAREEANRFNLLEESWFFDSAEALLGPDPGSYIDRYKFDIAPATDDRPYFFDFFRWRSLPELIALRSLAGPALLDWGYLILVATLAQAALLSLVLILAPLRLRGSAPQPAITRWRVAGYFLAIGLAFLFIEIASIQRFLLFLGHPLYAAAVVLSGFLVFAGLGSAAAPALAARLAASRRSGAASIPIRPPGPARRGMLRPAPINLAVAAIAILTLLHILILPALIQSLIPLPQPARIALALAVIAPLAFFMGMPFPLALAQVATRMPAIVPWAWGINGCASVLSAVLATLYAIGVGFTAVLATAAALYLAAALIRWPEQAGPAGILPCR